MPEMNKNPVKKLVLFAAVILAMFAGVSLWLTAWNERARKEAFARHEHGRFQSRPCLLLPEDTDVGAVSGISDCLLLDPLGKKPDVFEIDLTTGMLVVVHTDLFLPGSIPLALTRVYRPGDTWVRGFGLSAELTYNPFPVGDRVPFTYMELSFQDGRQMHFDRVSPGTSYFDAVYRIENEPNSSSFAGSEVRWNGNGWTLKRGDGWVFQFPKATPKTLPPQGALVRLTNPQGGVVEFMRSPSGDLTNVRSRNGWFELQYDGRKVIRARDSSGRSVSYEYDGQERLIKVIEGSSLTEYNYVSSTFLPWSGVQDARRFSSTFLGGVKNGVSVLRCEYHRDGKVARVTLADGKSYEFTYTGNRRRPVTTITRSDGRIAVVTTTQDGYAATDWH